MALNFEEMSWRGKKLLSLPNLYAEVLSDEKRGNIFFSLILSNY